MLKTAILRFLNCTEVLLFIDLNRYSDYYPFGMIVPSRHGKSESYRYGFNGKEEDDELKGEGNSYDYGFRFYDSRIGKFLSTDPLQDVYPELTPYQFASNSPIQGVDLDGREIYHYTLFFPTDGRKPILTYLGEQTNFPSGIWPIDIIDKGKSEGFKDYSGDEIKSKSIEVHVIARENNGIANKPDKAKITFSYFSELNEWVKDGYSGSENERAFIAQYQTNLEIETAITQIQAGTPSSEEIVTSKVKRQQSAQSGRVLSKKEMRGIVGGNGGIGIKSKYANKMFKCKEFANDIVSGLKSKGVKGKILELNTPYSNIWNDKLGKNISTNGTHRGVQVGDKVFDNLNPEGVMYNDWIKQFDAPFNSLNVKTTDF